MIEPTSMRQLHQLHSKGWGTAIAGELGIARNTVKRYLKGGEAAKTQAPAGGTKPRRCGRRVGARAVRRRSRWQRRRRGRAASSARLRRAAQVQKVVATRRRERVAEAIASVRFGDSARRADADRLRPEGRRDRGRAHARVLARRGAELLETRLREGVSRRATRRLARGRRGRVSSLRGVPRTLLSGDNARSLVSARDRVAQTVTFHPGYLRVLPRLGGDSASVRALSRTHERQDRVGREVRQA